MSESSIHIFWLTLIFVVALAGGLWGALKSITRDTLHLFLSLAAGVFLGTVFLELLPEAFEIGGDGRITGAYALAGFLLTYLIERGLIPFISVRVSGKERTGHFTVAITALTGLCAHSLVEGAALAPAVRDGIDTGLYLAIIAHKLVASLALGSLFALSEIKTKRALTFLVFFALMTPLGAVAISPAIPPGAPPGILGYIVALTAGVFLYVATADILPEVMHSNISGLWKALLL
ncbi:MAG: ZIP family metal transporter, partial [candidate division Zixibacteria bacterium]|nr:ZIP family metal transporter [candidate division Zixibacteria bacterium]